MTQKPAPETRDSLPVHPTPVLPPSEGWTLTVRNGQRAFTLTAESAGDLPRTDLEDAFTCLAGWSTGPLRWQGVHLAALLEKVGPLDGAWIAVSAPDFRSVLRLDELPAETLLADRLDGSPLPREHGGPFRLVVPGGVCYQSVKWIQEIAVQDSDEGDTAREIALNRLRDEAKP
jgi:DMSO/TMAO reductase YedYZ molybdopterin-dependent catalytic subunit